MRTPKAKNPPERIWLQVGEIERDCEFKHCEEVTWCVDHIFETDLEYRLVKSRRRRKTTAQIKAEAGKPIDMLLAATGGASLGKSAVTGESK